MTPFLKVIDFNVAVTFNNTFQGGDGESNDSECSIKGGTGLREWSAPETRQKLYYDKLADLWSVGCILYFMVTGTPPFVSNKKKFDFQDQCKVLNH